MPELRVVIDARLRSGQSGGVEQVVIGVASGLAALEGPERYFFLVREGEDAWLRPYAGSSELVPERWDAGLTARARRAAGRLRAFSPRRAGLLPPSSGTVESLGADVMHFLSQNAFATRVPSIYHPWDLQHEHFPQFFEPALVRRRRRFYRAAEEQAAVISVASSWTRDDLIARHSVPAEKVVVVPMAAPLMSYRTAGTEAWEARALPASFLFYPASDWPHKNHARLFRALALARISAPAPIHLVLCGGGSDRRENLQRLARAAGVEDLVTDLGFVSPEEIQVLFSHARGLVFPSLFEGWGLPVPEAMAAGVPVACSNATSLPALCGDAALLFDPADESEMSAAMVRIAFDENLRLLMIGSGRRRAALFSWEQTARMFRALYRRVAGHPLDPWDLAALSAPPSV